MLHKKKKGLEFSWTNTPDHTQMQSGWWDTVWVNYSFMTHPRNHSIFIHKLCFPWTNDIRRKWCYQHYCYIQRIGDASQIWERWGDQQMFLRFTSWGKFNVMVTDRLGKYPSDCPAWFMSVSIRFPLRFQCRITSPHLHLQISTFLCLREKLL